MRAHVQNAIHYIVRRVIPFFFALLTWLLLVAAVVITFPLSLYALYKFWGFVRGSVSEATL